VEPTLELGKTASPTVAAPGTPITFTLDLAQTATSDSDAFDLRLEDVVPTGMTYVPGSFAWTGVGLAPSALDDSAAPNLVARWDDFPLGSSSQVEFRATLGSLPPGTVVGNRALLEWTSLPDDNVTAPFSLSPFNELATERSYDPGSPANVYGVEASASVTVPSLPATGFAPGRRTELPAGPPAEPLAQLGEFRLEIPAFDVEIPIVGVPAAEGEWDVTWLWTQAGHLAGTAFPGQPGNSALTGHVYLPSGAPGPFARLGDLAWGDEIVVRAGEQRFVYEVRQVLQVRPGDLSPLRQERLSWLTLLTCQGYDEARDTYRWRLAVRAVLVRVE
jgi:LPXTG-site transpeptidase (sortase) family protein